MKRKLLLLILLGICFCGTSAFAEGIDSYTKLLIHADGVDGSTSFINSSFYGHTITSNGAQIDSSVKEFGTGSASFQGDDYLTMPDSDDWHLGADNFTIDFWIKLKAEPDYPATASYFFFGQQADPTHFWKLMYFDNSGSMQFMFQCINGLDNIITLQTPSSALGTTDLHHIAMVRNGASSFADWQLYIDGVPDRWYVTTGSPDAFIPNLNSSLYIGYNGIDSSAYMSGFLDEIRLSKEIARWTSDFTPPTEPYSVIPEPASLSLLGLGLFGLAFKRKKISK